MAHDLHLMIPKSGGPDLYKFSASQYYGDSENRIPILFSAENADTFPHGIHLEVEIDGADRVGGSGTRWDFRGMVKAISPDRMTRKVLSCKCTGTYSTQHRDGQITLLEYWLRKCKICHGEALRFCTYCGNWYCLGHGVEHEDLPGFQHHMFDPQSAPISR